VKILECLSAKFCIWLLILQLLEIEIITPFISHWTLTLPVQDAGGVCLNDRNPVFL
jgi:hypothetical protein